MVTPQATPTVSTLGTPKGAFHDHALHFPELEMIADANGREIVPVTRPYWCRVPNCGRRYKNLNGLKYHARVSHPHLDFMRHVKGSSSYRPPPIDDNNENSNAFMTPSMHESNSYGTYV